MFIKKLWLTRIFLNIVNVFRLKLAVDMFCVHYHYSSFIAYNRQVQLWHVQSTNQIILKALDIVAQVQFLSAYN